MSRDDDVLKQKRKTASPDALINPTGKGEITLSEDELSRASGGLTTDGTSGERIKKVALIGC